MAITVTAAGNKNLSAVSTIATNTVTLATGTNLILMGVASDTPLSTVTDSGSRTYTIINFGSVTGLNLYVAYTLLASPLGAPTNDTVTATLTGTGNVSMCAAYASGLASTSAQDKTNSANGTSTSPNSGNVTTTNNNELLIGFMGCVTGNNETFTAGTGWTNLSSNSTGTTSHVPSNLMQQIVSSTGTYSANASMTASSLWLSGIITFSDTTISGGGGGGSGQNYNGAMAMIGSGS